MYIGEIHKMTFMSWIHNENSWGVQFKAYKEKELREPLPLRDESDDPTTMFYEWHQVIYRKDIKDRVFPL